MTKNVQNAVLFKKVQMLSEKLELQLNERQNQLVEIRFIRIQSDSDQSNVCFRLK